MARRRPIAVLGCGAVGSALAVGLAAAGEELVLWSRRAARARSTARRAGRRVRVAESPEAALAQASLGLLCLPEEVQLELVGRLAPGGAPVLLTVSGGAPLAPLARRARGRSVGRLHPLVPVLAGARVDTFHGMPFGLEGPPAALRGARRLCRELAGSPLELRPGRAARYHAGAALLGGGLVALLALAEAAQAPAVRQPRRLRPALAAFAARNLAQYAAHGASGALTGPAARGAAASVRAHLAALAGVPGAREAYRVLGLTMVALAARRGTAAPSALARVRRELAR